MTPKQNQTDKPAHTLLALRHTSSHVFGLHSGNGMLCIGAPQCLPAMTVPSADPNPMSTVLSGPQRSRASCHGGYGSYYANYCQRIIFPVKHAHKGIYLSDVEQPARGHVRGACITYCDLNW